MVPAYRLKTPIVIDIYGGEYPVAYDGREYLSLFKASGKNYDNTITRDSRVREYVAQAISQRRRYGLYHFLLPNSISEQATFFLKLVDELGGRGDCPLIVDVECSNLSKYGINTTDWAYQVKVFLDLIEASVGYKPIIYTSTFYWSFLTDANGNQPAWSSDYPLWIAQYPYPSYVDGARYPSYIPPVWKGKWAIWQYAQDGRTQGYLANDYNIVSPWFQQELETRWFRDIGGETMPVITRKATVRSDATAGLVVRSTAGGLSTGVKLYPGTAVEGVGELVRANDASGVSRLWMNIITPNLGWVAVDYLNITWVAPENPPAGAIVFEPFVLNYTVDGVPHTQRFIPE